MAGAEAGGEYAFVEMIYSDVVFIYILKEKKQALVGVWSFSAEGVWPCK